MTSPAGLMPSEAPTTPAGDAPGSAPAPPAGLKHLSPSLEFLSKLSAGAVAGIVGVSLTYPLDFAKTRLQKASAGQYRGMGDVLGQVARAQGVRGWYAGIRANLAGIIPEKAIKLACNDQFRDLLRGPDGSVGLAAELAAGAGAGFCQVVVTTPMEMVKIRCQLSGRSVGQVVGDVGLRGLYQGYVPTLVRDVWFSMLFFPMQAKLKQRLARPDDSASERMAKSFLAGISAGMVASGLSTPVDVVKTRAQAGDGSLLQVLRATLQHEGPAALWKGLGPRMVAIGPLFGIAVMVYDLQKRLLKRLGYHVPEK